MTTKKDYVAEAGFYIEQRMQEVMRELEVLQKVSERSADRTLTAEEQRQWDELTEEAKQLTREINYRRSQRICVPASGPIGATRSIANGTGMTYVTDRGEERNALRPNEKMVPDVNFSLDKLVRGVFTSNWQHAEHERRTMSSLIDTSGGMFIGGPEVSGIFFDLARAKMQSMNAGAQVVPMTSPDFTFVRQTSDVTASWRPETGVITSSDGAFGAVTMRSHNLAAATAVSNELLMDSPPNFGSILLNSIAQAMALEFDRVCWKGLGIAGGEPGPGIVNDDAVTVTQKAGAAVTPDNLSAAVKAIRTANFSPNCMILPPSIWGQYDIAKDGTGNYLGRDNFPPSVRDLLWLDTSQLSDEVIIGDFSQLVIGVRQQLQIETFKAGSIGGVDALEKNLTWFRATLRGDVAVMRGSAFYVYDGALTS